MKIRTNFYSGNGGNSEIEALPKINLDHVQFSPGLVSLHAIGEYVSQASFNWLLLPCWFFCTGQCTSVLLFGLVFGRLVTHRYSPVCQ